MNKKKKQRNKQKRIVSDDSPACFIEPREMPDEYVTYLEHCESCYPSDWEIQYERPTYLTVRWKRKTHDLTEQIEEQVHEKEIAELYRSFLWIAMPDLN